MKRVLLIPILSLLLWGCSKADDIINEGGDVNQSAPISISIDSESLTRGGAVETEEAMGTVGLYCAYTGQDDWSNTFTETDFNKMNNAKFVYNKEKTAWDWFDNEYINPGGQPAWGYTSITDKYTFFAYSPFLPFGITPSIVNGALQLECKYGLDDLLVATPRKNIHPQSGGKVHMTFNHVASKIEFTAKIAEGVIPSEPLVMKRVNVKQVYNGGILNFADDNSYSWSLTGENKGTSSCATVEVGLSSGEMSILKNGCSFMMPQPIAPNKQQLELVYSYLGEERSVAFDLPVDLEQGQAYNFIFTLDNKFEWELSYTVDDWNDQSVEEDIDATEFEFLDGKRSYSLIDVEANVIKIPFECNRDDSFISVSAKYGKAAVVVEDGVRYVKYTPNNLYNKNTDNLIIAINNSKNNAKTKYSVSIKGRYYDFSFAKTYPDVANCYIIKPTTENEIIIPINEYISYFWTNYGQNSTEKDYAKLSNLKASVLWDDTSKNPIKSVSIVSVDPGVTTKSNPNVTYPDFTASTSTMAMKIKINKNIPGNVVIAVKSGDTVLWSWHLWISTYNPYDNVTSNGTTYTVDSDLKGMKLTWMDRNIGARAVAFNKTGEGNLYYQWGRKDPFPELLFESSIPDGITIGVAPTIITEGVKNPSVYFSYDGQGGKAGDWCGVPEDGKRQDHEYHWRDNKLAKTELYKKAFGNTKSIFDPSPLGFMVPCSTSKSEYVSPFTFLKDSKVTSSSSSVQDYSLRYSKNTSFLFPGVGLLSSSYNGSVGNWSNCYYWTAAPYCNIVGFTGGYSHCGYDLYCRSSNSVSTYYPEVTNTDWPNGDAMPIRPIKQL